MPRLFCLSNESSGFRYGCERAVPVVECSNRFVGIQFPSESLFNRIQVTHKLPTPLSSGIALDASVTFREFLKLFFQFLKVRHRIHWQATLTGFEPVLPP